MTKVTYGDLESPGAHYLLCTKKSLNLLRTLLMYAGSHLYCVSVSAGACL